MTGIKRLFYDIETSPNIVFSWRTGSKIFIDHSNIIQERAIICICYKWENKGKVYSLTWDNGSDKKLLKQFIEVISEADELVAHNGDKFDLRWINARTLIHGFDPIPHHKTVDTLKIARKHFYLNSNKLDYLSNLLLGEGKINTDFSLWKEVCLNKSDKALSSMVKYCKRDVELLERVYRKLINYDLPSTHVGVLNGLDRWTCPYCGSDEVKLSKTRPTPKGILQRQMQCKKCARYYSVCDSVYKDYLVAKEG